MRACQLVIGVCNADIDHMLPVQEGEANDIGRVIRPSFPQPGADLCSQAIKMIELTRMRVTGWFEPLPSLAEK
jgi:hypothetical protein